MIYKRTEFLQHTGLDENTLELWLTEEWIIPAQADQDVAFSEADLARAKLISELATDMGVNPPGIGVALHLLDQVHSLRRALAGLGHTS
jgi:chaperone modulatory protein CbpM